MLKTFIRPKLVKRYNMHNVRPKCDLNCKERCINLIGQQTESLNKISKLTEIITIVTVFNFVTPAILTGSAIIFKLIIQ